MSSRLRDHRLLFAQTAGKETGYLGYGWAAGGVAAATVLFWLARGHLDKGNASLLYLPVVLACAIRYGQGPAALGAIGSFLCWNYFFLPPYGSWIVRDPKDWLALLVFLVTALVTTRLAAQAREQTREAQAREQESRVLQEASQRVSAEVDTTHLLPALGRQLVTLCAAGHCAIYRASSPGGSELILAAFLSASHLSDPILEQGVPPAEYRSEWLTLANFAHHQKEPVGFAASPERAFDPVQHRRLGVFVPLLADGQSWGVVHVGPRHDRHLYSLAQERVILALASHAAVALARQAASEEAAQAQALRESDELKNALLSLVSHELRTPLASIKASASGLLQSNAILSMETVLESLQAIDEESDRLGALVGKLLDLSRLEAGAWRPELDWCDLVDVLGIALARLPGAASERIRVEAAADLPLVRADSVQIAQVMTNLLENALKYAPAGSPIIVTLQSHGTDVCVDIADTGLGIPAGEVEAIFERFYRLPAHRKSGLGGTGLGLAICRGIMEAHGGRIGVKNQILGGAVFSFALPLPVSVPKEIENG
jgi:two-component system sensor histidine kinase KdpD